MAGEARNILITGANRGLGLEMVKQLLEKPCPGRRIFTCCRDPTKAQDLQELAKKHPGVVHVIRLDVADVSSIQGAAKDVGSVLGKDGLNLLVNNAAVANYGNLKTTGPKEMHECFDTNVVGPMMITKEFLPYLCEAAKCCGKAGMSCSKAAVINISSIVGSCASVSSTCATFPVMALSYRISKSALNMLTLSNVEEFKEDGILFTLIHPGWVRTNLGGEDGHLDTKESVSAILRVLDSLTEKQNGAFLDFNGQTVPW